MRCTDLMRGWIVCLAMILIYSSAYAQKKSGAPEEQEPTAVEQADRFFDMKVPQGFAPEAVDEPGILKWKKDSGEIYLVVGNLFTAPGDTLFKALREAADKDKKLEEVRTLQIRGERPCCAKKRPRTIPDGSEPGTCWS